MNILLLNPKLKTWSPNVYVPLGLAYIAAVLEQAGNRVEIADLNVKKVSDDDLREKVKSANIVGITGMITEYNEVVRLADLVKGGGTEIVVIFGGPIATTVPRELLQASQADFAVIGGVKRR